MVAAGLTAGPAVGAKSEERPSARLLYTPAPSVRGCPEEAEVRAAVAGRLGYAPFRDDARRVIVVRIGRERGLFAQVELRGEGNQLLGSRRLSSERGDCAELVAAAELAISIAIDPLGMARATAPPLPVEPLRPAPPAPPPPPPVTIPASAPVPRPPRPRARPPRLQTGLGLLIALSTEPATTVGFAAHFGLRWPWVSASLEGRADVPAVASGEGPRAQASLLLAGLVPCLHYRFALACPLGMLGALRGTAVDVAAPRQATTLYAALGLRLGVEFTVWRFLSLRVAADLYGVLTPTTLFIDEKAAWQSPPLSGSLGWTLAGNFL